MNDPLVSVVIPHYNRPQLLEAAVGSALASTYRNFEIIVVDDGSDAEARLAIERLAGDRVRVLDRENGIKGPSRCRNIGVKECRGELVIFLDSDDVMADWCLEQRVGALQDSPHEDMWVFPVLLFTQEPGDRNTLWNRMHGDRDDATRFAMSDPVWHTSSPLWRKDAFLRVGGFNEKVFYGDDTDLHLRALVSGLRIKKIADAIPDVFIRRSDSPRITSSLSPELIESRRVRLTEGSHFLKAARASSDLMRAFEGQYFVEAEFLLFNAREPRDAIIPLLEKWERDYPETTVHRAIAAWYLALAMATRDKAYMVLRVARRTTKLLSPAEYFPRGGTFSTEEESLSAMSEVRLRLRGKADVRRPFPVE